MPVCESTAAPQHWSAAACGARRRWAGLLALASAVLVGQACYHYRAVPVQPITEEDVGGALPLATEYESETAWALAWGLVQTRPEIDNCEGQGLAEVRVTTNLGYALLTVATLGFASPARVQWACAKQTPRPVPIGVDTVFPPPAADAQATAVPVGRAGLSHETVAPIAGPRRLAFHPRTVSWESPARLTPGGSGPP